MIRSQLSGWGVFEALGDFCTLGPQRRRATQLELLAGPALDIVTAPLQVTFLYPAYGLTYLYENTGSRTRRKDEIQREQEEERRYRALLEEDGERMFAMPDFRNPTNHAALSAQHLDC